MPKATLETIDAKLADQQRERDAEAAETFRALAVAIADGDKIDEAETIAALETLGKTTADLRARAEVVKERRALAAVLERGPASRERHAEIQLELKRLGKEEEAAIRHCHRMSLPLIEESARLDFVLGFSLDSARAKLLGTAEPALLAKEAELLAEDRKLGKTAYWMEQPTGEMSHRNGDDSRGKEMLQYSAPALSLYNLRRELRSVQVQLAHREEEEQAPMPEQVRAVERLTGMIAQQERRKAGIERRRADLGAELASLRERMLQP